MRYPTQKPTYTTTTITCRVEKQWMTVFRRLKVYQQKHPQKLTREYHDSITTMQNWDTGWHQQRLDLQQELLTDDQQQLLKSIEFEKREYLSSTHKIPNYLTEHLNGIYELAAESGFQSNVSNYWKQTFGEKHGKHRRKLSHSLVCQHTGGRFGE